MKALLILTALWLTGCAQINSLGVSEGDNAMACLKGSSGATAGVFGGDISGVTVELPSSVDTSSWTAADWRQLAEICD